MRLVNLILQDRKVKSLGLIQLELNKIIVLIRAKSKKECYKKDFKLKWM